MSKKYPSQLIKFGEKVKGLRNAKNLTQEQLGNKCDISMRTIIRIESGDIAPTLNVILAFANAFEMTASDLLQGIKKETTKKK